MMKSVLLSNASVLWASQLLLSSVSVEGFQLGLSRSAYVPKTICHFGNDGKPPDNRVCHEQIYRPRFFDSESFGATRTITKKSTSLTSLAMIKNGNNDPEVLLQMAEELASKEITPETMEQMGELQIALSEFLEKTSAALLLQDEKDEQQKPPPPSTPPPGSLLEVEANNYQQQQQQDRDLATDLANAGTALELLQERLRQEEEALLLAEWELREGYSEKEEKKSYLETDIDEEDILFQAEEALRKSREAAEKRRSEAEQRSLTAARVSAEYLRQQAKEQIQQQQQQQQQQNEMSDKEELVTEQFDGSNPYEEVFAPSQNQGGESDVVPRMNIRPTMELQSITQEDPQGDKPFSIDSSGYGSSTPVAVPILYNWVQDEEGCISGNVRGSMNFKDGSKISTSSVAFGARSGSTVVTESGSRYFLEEPKMAREDYGEERGPKDSVTSTQKPSEENYDASLEAPDGVPTVKRWEYVEGGGIIGLIYGSQYADDGDYIETSPIVDGEIDNYSVVSTRSGSRYFLSGDPPEDYLDTLSSFRDDDRLPNERNERSKRKQGGTITLPKLAPRSTFSLFKLFDSNSGTRSSGNADNQQPVSYLRNDDDDEAPPQPLPPPSPDKVPPVGTPALTGCVFNKNGTITGYVFGSPKIEDGYLITTSPVVDGERKQFETVITASGSVYYLG